MDLERLNPNKFRVTLHAYELAALISAARWIIDGAKGELPKEATEQLSQIVAAYDTETTRVNSRDEKS